MQVAQRPIDIVLPENFKSNSRGSIELCELFISGLLTSDASVIDITVDLTTKHIVCNEKKLKEIIFLIVGAKKLDEFTSQLLQLLHPSSNSKSFGELVCKQDSVVRRFTFISRSGGALDWRVIAT